jgi:zinc protease
MNVRAMVVAGVALMLSCTTAIRGPTGPERRTKMNLHVVAFEAGNGLRVISLAEPEAQQVSVLVRYDVGAKDDPQGQEGIAHLAEHLMFLQTHQGKDLTARLDEAATYYNAFTSVDATTYIARARPDRLADLLEVEGLRLALRCESITEEIFQREREVVLNELRQGAAETRILEAVTGAVFAEGHPYRRTPAGNERSVAAITRDQVCAFIDAHYAPGNAVVVVSGGATEQEVDAALGKIFGRVPKRGFTPPRKVPALSPRGGKVRAAAPIDEDRVVIAWPMPNDPAGRAKMRAVGGMVWGRVNAAIKGRVSIAELGGGGAELFALVISPATGESVGDAIAGAQRGVDGTPQWMEPAAFERSKQVASYNTFAVLEDRTARDSRLAAELLAGHAPADAIGAELTAVNGMTRDNARAVARETLSWSQATVVTLVATPDPAGVGESVVGRPIHDAERRRPASDGSGADKAATFDASTSPLSRAQTRTLASGMTVILLPVSSVPTVDVRLVFPAGRADDPDGQAGAADLAANSLGLAGSDLAALDAFYASGGQLSIDVSSDATTFSATGMDMAIDHLLTGLERLVRNGRYDGPRVDETVAATRKRLAAEAASSDADTSRRWREGIYGVDHPYVTAGWTMDSLGADALGGFRDRHYRPGKATLIIAGGFDPALATKWIDHLFADWSGAAPTRTEPLAKLGPRALDIEDDGSQLGIAVAWPADPKADRAEQLIAAEMLDAAAADVRRELAASYGITAALVESRLAAWYSLRGHVDSARAAEAFSLLKVRVEELRDGGAEVAPQFVTARRRVLERVSAVDTGATALAAHVAGAYEVGRDLVDELALVEEVRKTTLADMGAALVGLDLTRAVVMVRGPEPQLAGAMKALGVGK